MNKFTLGILMICMIGLVSANGINIVNNNVIVNKTNGIDLTFKLNITNQETFKFYNITSDSSILIFNKFDLESGQTKEITFKINSNENFNEEIKLIGTYFANLGSSSETEIVTIDSTGLDICNLDLIQGDSIVWNNTILGEVKLKNLNSGEYISTIAGKNNYNYLFSTPIEFNYQVYQIGLPFSQICHINIRPESGYIHSSEYDGTINLNMNINYNSTKISTNFLTDSYSIDYNSEKEDIFKITNTGNSIAKNIDLHSDWLSFGTNNFDLAIGESKNIEYTISPEIYKTEETDKTYTKTIKIEGNFETYEKNISIFINYKYIAGTSNESSYDRESGKQYVLLHCKLYPEDCPVNLIYENETNKNVTFTINEETYKESVLADASFREESRNNSNNQNEKLYLLENLIYSSLNNSNETRERIENLEEDTGDFLGVVTSIMIAILFIIIIVIILVIIFNDKANIKVKNIFRKGELKI